MNIYDYLDYRTYLRDFYLRKKAANPNFSYQVFADKAGFRSKSQIKLIIDGKRNVTPRAAEQINRVLRLGDKAFSYFKDLVAFCQTKSNDERARFLLRLAEYNKRSPARVVLRHQYELYAQWYHNTIRELVAHCELGDDHDRLAKSTAPPILVTEARRSLAMLLELGLLEKRGNRYAQTDRVISTGDEVRSVAVRAFHRRNMELAAQSIDTFERDERDISSLVVGLSDQGFATIKKEIQQFRKRLLRIVEADTPVHRVYHINFQIFPTSKRMNDEER
jgi:uncharacterized protein (TIGR02147 family)